jgi:DNA-directed RNA polymerase subunit RPC12/RpoP
MNNSSNGEQKHVRIFGKVVTLNKYPYKAKNNYPYKLFKGPEESSFSLFFLKEDPTKLESFQLRCVSCKRLVELDDGSLNLNCGCSSRSVAKELGDTGVMWIIPSIWVSKKKWNSVLKRFGLSRW